MSTHNAVLHDNKQGLPLVEEAFSIPRGLRSSPNWIVLFCLVNVEAGEKPNGVPRPELEAFLLVFSLTSRARSYRFRGVRGMKRGGSSAKTLSFQFEEFDV